MLGPEQWLSFSIVTIWAWLQTKGNDAVIDTYTEESVRTQCTHMAMVALDLLLHSWYNPQRWRKSPQKAQTSKEKDANIWTWLQTKGNDAVIYTYTEKKRAYSVHAHDDAGFRFLLAYSVHKHDDAAFSFLRAYSVHTHDDAGFRFLRAYSVHIHDDAGFRFLLAYSVQKHDNAGFRFLLHSWYNPQRWRKTPQKAQTSKETDKQT